MSTNLREPATPVLSSRRLEEPVEASATTPPAPKPARLVSLDAYRGFIMFILAAEGFGIYKVARNINHIFPFFEKLGGFFTSTAGVLNGLPFLSYQPGKSAFWDVVGYQFDHTEWTGCSFWDLIQPSFMFMVGVAMPYSYASRRAKGDSDAKLTVHAVYRAVVLVFLGIFLMSNGQARTDWTFVNVLTQIGLGYVFVYLLLDRGWRVQLVALTGILVGYWLFFALWPLPGSGFDYATVGVPATWEHFTGLFAHWDKNTNAAAAFDDRFLNLFRRPGDEFHFNEGGYQTLNFIPSMATMIFGLMAGEMLRSQTRPWQKFLWLVLAGVGCLALGWVLDQTVCPSVKRIWTPSWAVYSSGWTFLMLAGFFAVIDLAGFKRWAFPRVVVGMNSIAVYCMGMTLKGWIRGRLQAHVGGHIFDGIYGPMVQSVAVALVIWLVCLWMYRRKVFLRV
ncbi:MAG TPA: DUF5009 domain-containing protein [Gemmataceae bacterium]|nr:DUF5009 domain-containing protein [Gemmataceae bacterium]